MGLPGGERRRLERQAEVLCAIAHPIRLAITQLLRDGGQCACDIAERAGAQPSNVSRHPSVLARAGIVEGRKEGVSVYDTLKTPCILNVLDFAMGVLRQAHEEGGKLLRHSGKDPVEDAFFLSPDGE